MDIALAPDIRLSGAAVNLPGRLPPVRRYHPGLGERGRMD